MTRILPYTKNQIWDWWQFKNKPSIPSQKEILYIFKKSFLTLGGPMEFSFGKLKVLVNICSDVSRCSAVVFFMKSENVSAFNFGIFYRHGTISWRWWKGCSWFSLEWFPFG
jgi:hypothetical protein